MAIVSRDKGIDRFGYTKEKIFSNSTVIYSALGKNTDPLSQTEDSKEAAEKITDENKNKDNIDSGIQIFAGADSLRKKELFIGIESTDANGSLKDTIEATNLDRYKGWRQKQYNRVVEVSEQVGFFPDKVSIKPSVKLTRDEQTKDILGTYLEAKNKFWDKALTGALLASGAISPQSAGDKSSSIRMYTQYKGFKEVGQLFENVNFEIPFSFGQFGLFNAYQEVVSPMMAITGLFAPYPNGALSDGVSLFHTPYPNSNYLMAKQALSIFGTPGRDQQVKSSSKDGAKADAPDGKDNDIQQPPNPGALNQFLTAVEQHLLQGVIKSISVDNGLTEGKWKYATFRYGNFKIGPCEVKSVESKFDFKQVDEFGFPYKGVLTISAICLTNAVSSAIEQSFLR